jgi:hypothetical protein
MRAVVKMLLEVKEENKPMLKLLAPGSVWTEANPSEE